MGSPGHPDKGYIEKAKDKAYRKQNKRETAGGVSYERLLSFPKGPETSHSRP